MNKYGLDLELDRIDWPSFWQINQFYLLILFLLLLIWLAVLGYRSRYRPRQQCMVGYFRNQTMQNLADLRGKLAEGVSSPVFYADLVFQIKKFIKGYYGMDVLALTDTELVQALEQLSKTQLLVGVLKQLQTAATQARFACEETEWQQMDNDLRGVESVIEQILGSSQ